MLPVTLSVKDLPRPTYPQPPKLVPLCRQLRIARNRQAPPVRYVPRCRTPRSWASVALLRDSEYSLPAVIACRQLIWNGDRRKRRSQSR